MRKETRTIIMSGARFCVPRVQRRHILTQSPGMIWCPGWANVVCECIVCMHSRDSILIASHRNLIKRITSMWLGMQQQLKAHTLQTGHSRAKGAYLGGGSWGTTKNHAIVSIGNKYRCFMRNARSLMIKLSHLVFLSPYLFYNFPHHLCVHANRWLFNQKYEEEFKSNYGLSAKGIQCNAY